MMAQRNATDRAHRYRANPSDESVQDKSWREYTENFERVSRSPETASAKDLRRALGYLDKARRSFIRRAQEKGISVDGNVLAGYDNEFEYLKSLMLQRERGNPWPFSKPVSARQTTPARGGIAHHSGTRKPSVSPKLKRAAKKAESGGYLSIPDEKTLQEGFARGLSLSDMLKANPSLRRARDVNPAKFDRCVKEVQAKGGDVNAYAVCTAATKRKKNSAVAAAEAFKEFHGYPSEELVSVTQKVHRHEHLAAAGDLVGLQVRPTKGGPVRHIEGLGDALLTFNEAKNQLFVSGGDQFLSSSELKKFVADPNHELLTLGRVKGVGYFTDKTHLGDEGGEAVYSHTFRTTNKAGRHVVVRIAKEPDLIYRVLDQQMELSGGSYEIKAEGIDK
jgi:hypothetical protein